MISISSRRSFANAFRLGNFECRIVINNLAMYMLILFECVFKQPWASMKKEMVPGGFSGSVAKSISWTCFWVQVASGR